MNDDRETTAIFSHAIQSIDNHYSHGRRTAPVVGSGTLLGRTVRMNLSDVAKEVGNPERRRWRPGDGVNRAHAGLLQSGHSWIERRAVSDRITLLVLSLCAVMHRQCDEQRRCNSDPPPKSSGRQE